MARSFNGINNGDKVVFPSTVYDFIADQTITFWFRRGGTNHRDIMWARWTSTVAQRQLQVYFLAGGSADHIQVDVPFVAAIMTSAGTISDIFWHHLAVTRSGNNWVLYIDGAQDQTATVAATQETGAVLTIGQDPVDINHFTFGGDLAEFAGFNRALTAGEVAGLAKGSSPCSIRPGLKFYTPFFGRNTEVDEVGGGTSTITGTLYAPHPRMRYPTGAPSMKESVPSTLFGAKTSRLPVLSCRRISAR